MIDKDQLQKLYTSYGFDVDRFDENLAVFAYRRSRYFGVDIILFSENSESIIAVESLKKQYAEIGYAVNQKSISSNDDAELELFKSFFGFDSSIQRLKRKYNEFTSKQTMALLGNRYEYVEAPFDIYNEVNSSQKLFELLLYKLKSDNAELIIIEAAAGYGKTCTAYEVLNCLATESNNQIPIFTELSRNRRAKIFRYILLDEIDTEFSSLNSELVVKEIKNGRIPVIVDGFDELLDKSTIESTVVSDSFEEVESMLDTIGNLLHHKCKVILTTRKTAIFTGPEFDTWINKWSGSFMLTRIALKEPRIKDWLGQEKFELVKSRNVPIRYVANPVILTFLKNVEFENFSYLLDSPEILVQQYFRKMLEREQERQNLPMRVEHQLQVFRNVARSFVEFDIVSEEKEFLKEIIYDENKSLIEETRNLYGSDKPSVKNLLDTLSNHALLDRKGRDQNQVGFINDFVLGTFVGELLIESTPETVRQTFSPYMIETAVTAYRVQSPGNKLKIWEKIQDSVDRFSSVSVFSFDIYLREAVVREHSEISIYDFTFFNIHFSDKPIISSVFVNCYFRGCQFTIASLQGVSFVECIFDRCTVVDNPFLDDTSEIATINCKEVSCSVLADGDRSYELSNQDTLSKFEKQVLSKLFDISYKKGHHIVQLQSYFDKTERKAVFKSLKALEEKDLIRVRGIHVNFDINKIAKIKSILGRNDI